MIPLQARSCHLPHGTAGMFLPCRLCSSLSFCRGFLCGVWTEVSSTVMGQASRGLTKEKSVLPEKSLLWATAVGFGLKLSLEGTKF